MKASASSFLEEKGLTPPPSILRVYQTPAPPSSPRDQSIQGLKRYVAVAIGHAQPATHTDPHELHKAARDIGQHDLEGLPAAVAFAHESQGAEVEIEKSVKFAGRVVNIKQTIKKDSRAYQNYLRELSGKSRLGGALGTLDAAAADLASLQNISSVAKSQADWSAFKTSTNIADDLDDASRGGWLDRQKFLAGVDAAQVEKMLELSRQRRAMIAAAAPPAQGQFP